MKNFIRVLILCGLIGLCIGLFQAGHTFWAFMLIALILAVDTHETRNYKNDLEWISNAMMDSREFDSYKEERHLFGFLQRCMNEKKIKVDQSVSDIRKVIDGYVGLKSNDLAKFKFDYLLDDKEPSKIHKIYVRGYGGGIPTPKITLKVRYGKLIEAKTDIIWG